MDLLGSVSIWFWKMIFFLDLFPWPFWGFFFGWKNGWPFWDVGNVFFFFFFFFFRGKMICDDDDDDDHYCYYHYCYYDDDLTIFQGRFEVRLFGVGPRW